MTDKDKGSEKTANHEPAIWNQIREKIRGGGDQDISIECKHTWDDLNRLLDDDAFQHGLAESDAYAAFFARALIGQDKDQKVCEECCVTSDPPGEARTATTVSVPRIWVNRLKDTSDEAFIGADLVARVSLTVARRICKTSGCSFSPRLDCHQSQEDRYETPSLRFLSADFMVAEVMETKAINHSQDYSGDCCPDTYYHFGWDKIEPKSHGWRMKDEIEFTNDPNSKLVTDTKNNTLDSLLGYPAFLRHEEANIIFALPPAEGQDIVVEPSGCLPYKLLYDLSIKPYTERKRIEYTSRCTQKSKGCIVLCLGVADQRVAYFDSNKFENIYAVFLTIDMECNKSYACSNQHCEKTGVLQRIVDDLKGVRYQIKFMTLQVLTGKLINIREKQAAELEEQTVRLKKSEVMLQQLSEPLKSLSDALGKTQADVQEIRAILYEPMEAIFARQERIAIYFEQNQEISNPDGSQSRIAHQPNRYGLESRLFDAEWVLAHVLATIRGAEVSEKESALALKAELTHLTTASTNGTSSFRRLAVTTLAFIDYRENIDLNVVAALESLKRRLFKPFKPDSALDAIEGDVIAALLPNDATFENLDRFISVDAIPGGVNPFATQGHLLRFISGVVSATFNDTNSGCKKYSITATADGTSINRSDGTPWVINGDAKRLFKVLSREILSFMDGNLPLEENWGDHADPFVRLLRRLPPEYRSGMLTRADAALSISLDGNMVFSCSITGDGIFIVIGELMITYGKNFYLGK